MVVIATLFIIPFVSLSFAAETPGGVIAGTMVWQVWRFRESNPKAKPTPYEEKDEL
jgi:PDZ domain-containing secreted protein